MGTVKGTFEIKPLRFFAGRFWLVMMALCFALPAGSVMAQTSTPTLTIATSGTPSTSGGSVTLTATISSGPTGTVTFYDKGTSLGTGTISGTTATLATSTLAVGIHTITVSWPGNTNYSAVTSRAIAQAVNNTAQTTTLSISPSTITVGTAVTLTATVKNGSTAISPGLVRFCDASAPECEDMAVLGTAQLTSAGTAAMGLRLGVGTHRIYAVFAGTSTYPASTSSTQTVAVSSGSGTYVSSTALAISGNASNYTLSGTVGGLGPSAPTGTVTFLDTSNGNAPLGSATLGSPGYALQSPVLYGDNGSYCYDTNCIAVASDVDGDGIPDIVYTNWNTNTVSVSIGNGDGTFLTPVSYATGSGSTPGNLAIGDFNGDGVPDLAVSNSGTNTVGIFLGNGNGTFQPQVTYATWTTPEGITVGDFNGDGIEDLLVLDGNINAISVLLGNGDGTFQPQMRAAVVTPHPFAVAVGDFNGDGILDAAVTINTENASTTSVGIFLGNGNGTFQSPITYPAGVSLSIAVADFNQDGIPDLVYSNQSGNTVSVMLGNGDGTFQAAVPYTAGSNVGGVAIGDFNQDGIPDIVVQNLATTAILLGNGDGTFQPQIGYTASGGGVAVADVNGDGLPDVVSVNGQLSVLLDAHVANYSASGISFTGAVGVHNVVASYPGSSPYAASTSNTAQLTSSNTTPTLSVSSSGSPSTYGGSVTFTATISSGPTGTVVFYDGATSIGTGTLSGTTATFTTSTLASGSHTITARWAGNSTYSPVTSAAITQVVNLAMPTLGVTTSGTPTTPGGSVTFTATISNGLTGTVTFYDRGTSIGTGTISVATATFVTTTLTVGIHTITASWPGNTSYAPVTSRAITQAVNNTAQTTTLSISPSTVTVGSAVTLTATVKNGSTAISPGLVRFCDASAPECEDMAVLGTAQLTSAGTAAMGLRLGVGTHRIYAVFAGTSTYAASTSSTQTVVVSSGSGTYASSTALLASGNASNYTLNGTVGGLGPTAPTGTVTFLDTSNGNAPLGSATLGSPGYALQGPVLYGDDSTLCYYANCIAVASDVDGDGIPDVVYTNYNSNVVSVSIGNGDGTFQTPVSYATGTTPGYLAIGDFNGDGVPDLAVSNSGSNTVGIFLGNGGGTFQPQVTYATWTTPMGITVGDFNGDGIEDLLVLDGNINAISVLLGNGDGTFQPQMRAAVVTPHPFAVAVGDFNGDGILDAAVTIDTENASTTSVGIFLGNGNGTFQSPITYPAGASLSIAVADFNQDGIPDLVYSNLHGNTVSVMLGNGDGTFQAAVSYASNTGPVAIGDFNQDGIPDIVTPGTVTTSVLLGNGDGTFQPQISYSATGSGIAVADLNGDGLPDVVSVNDHLSVLLDAHVANYSASGISFTGAVGPHNVVVSYPGSSPYAASTSSAVQLTSSNSTPTLSVASSGSPSTYGGSVTFTATISSGPTGTVTFYDGTTQIGTAILNGNLATYSTAILSAGNHSITVSWPGNSSYSGITSSPFLQVIYPAQATPTISISNIPASATYGSGFTVMYSYSGTGSPTESVSSNTPSVCTMSGSVVSYVGVGSCTLTASATATTADTAVTGTAQTFTVSKATPTISISNIPGSAAYSGGFTATYSYLGNGSPTVSSSTPSVCTVSGNAVSYVGAGSCTLTASATATTDDTAVTGTAQSFVVNKGTATIWIDSIPSNATYGGRFAVMYRYSGNGSPAESVTSNTPAVCTVSGNTVSYGGVGTCVLVASATATTDYAAATGGDQAFTVSAATSTISISNLPLSAVQGGSFTVTYSYSGNGSPTESVISSTPTVCTVSGSTVSYVGSGICTLVASATATSDYAAVTSGDQSFTVKATTTVSVWPTARAITYGQTLASSTLNGGTASVSGTFAWTTPSISPGAGTPSESVTFTPSNTTEYNAVIGSVNVMVNDTITLPAPGTINTVAGNGTCGYSGDGGAATSAELCWPAGVVVDASGNIYIADTSNQRIRKVTAATGIITTVAGNGTAGYSGDGGAATSAELNYPWAAAVDASGNIYIADQSNNRIRKVTASTGIITTVAGNGTYGYSGDGGAAASAELSAPWYVAVDANGNVYTAEEGNDRIRKMSVSTGIIATVAGNGTYGYSGDGGAATAAELLHPYGVALDTSGNIYIADFINERIRNVAVSTGIISTVAGDGYYYNGVGGYSGDGGAATSAELNGPTGVAVDTSGNIYIADVGNERIRRVNAGTGIITTVAGDGTLGSSGDGGTATSAEVNSPFGVAVDASGNIYVADYKNSRIRVVGAPLPTPTLNVGTSGTPSVYGAAVTFTATISNGPIGNLTFYDYGAPIGQGTINGTTATFTTSGLALGNHSITASWSGDPSYTSVTSSAITQTVGTLWDTGAVTLTVNGPSGVLLSSTTSYGAGSTPSSVAQGLAASNANVAVTAGDDTLYIAATQNTSGQSLSYSIATSWDSSEFSQPSFSGSPASGSLQGGGSTEGTPQAVYSYTAGYDGLGNVTSYVDSVMGTWNFGYDTLNRLATAASTPASGQQANPYPNYCWSYDSFGNRATQMSANVLFPNGQGGANTCSTTGSLGQNLWAQYNGTVNGTNNNQMSATVQNLNQGNYYDVAGNVTNDGVNQYLYDPEGRICAVASGSTIMTGYIYDADGNRVAKGTIQNMTSCDPAVNGFQPTSDYILGPSGEQMTEMGVNAGGNLAWKHTNVWAESKVLATYDSNGLHFYLDDPLSSRRVQTNYQGVTETSYQSLPFGDALPLIYDPNCLAANNCFTEDPTEHHFTGKEHDSESGNDYFGARYYSSSVGRWMSPDALNITEDRMMNPSSTLNKYAYAADNPLKYVDPDGQDITIFFENGVPGHIMMLAYDPSLPRAAYKSFGPAAAYSAHHWGSILTIPGIPVPATNRFGFEDLKSADAIRGKFASITLQTTPGVTQQVVQALLAHSNDRTYAVLGGACASSCARILHQIEQFKDAGNGHDNAITPYEFFNDLYTQYGNGNASTASGVAQNIFKPGTNYGKYQPSWDPFQIMALLINTGHPAPPRNAGCATNPNGQCIYSPINH